MTPHSGRRRLRPYRPSTSRGQRTEVIAYTRCSGGAKVEQTIALAMPLTDGVRCAALMWNTWRSKAHDPESESAPTEQAVRFQQRLLQLQKMEAVGELAGGIAHDFNNLLLVIRSYAEMLLEESDLSSTARHHSGEILAASRRAADLTRELLAFRRRQPLQLKPANRNGALDRAVPMFSRLVGKGIPARVQTVAGAVADSGLR